MPVDIDTRRHELRAELADSMAAIVREANPRTLRSLARDLDEDAAFHRGMLAMQKAKTPEEIDEACRLCGISPDRREAKHFDPPDLWTPERIDKIRLPEANS